MNNLFTRSKHNPILSPDPKHPWENWKLYNPGAIYHDDQYHLFYRARSWPSKRQCIGHAVSRDGVHFTRSLKPALSPRGKLELRGPEDPRITKIGDTFYMAYAAYNKITPRLCIATSKDLKSWRRRGSALDGFNFERAGGKKVDWIDGRPRTVPMPHEWSKSGGIFPEKINDKYWMLFGEFRIWLATSTNGLKWQPIKRPFIKPRRNHFDCLFVEMGPPPILTNAGYLVLYHGIDRHFVYQLGWLLLDRNDPTRIIKRCRAPIFEPQTRYEISDAVDVMPKHLKAEYALSGRDFLKSDKHRTYLNVIFCNGAVVRGNELRIYYGASDHFICTATAKLDRLLKEIR